MRRRRRAFVAALAGMLSTACISPRAFAAGQGSDPKLKASEWFAIRRTIDDQRKALKAGDARKAFSYASPEIRAQFRTPESFFAMVLEGYGALLDARYIAIVLTPCVQGVKRAAPLPAASLEKPCLSRPC